MKGNFGSIIVAEAFSLQELIDVIEKVIVCREIGLVNMVDEGEVLNPTHSTFATLFVGHVVQRCRVEKPGETITAKKYWYQIDEMHQKLQRLRPAKKRWINPNADQQESQRSS